MWNVNMTNDNHIVFWQKIDLTKDLLQEHVFDVTISQIPQGSEKSFHDDIERNSNFSVDGYRAVRAIKSDTSSFYAEQIKLVYSQQLIIITLRSNLSGNIGAASIIIKISDTTIFDQILAGFKFN
jgi:hypothetical protein